MLEAHFKKYPPRTTAEAKKAIKDLTGIEHSPTQISTTPIISANGRWVTFVSWASNLVVGDVNGFADVFVHDWLAGRTEWISAASSK